MTAIRRRLVHQKLGKRVSPFIYEGRRREVTWIYEYRRPVYYIQIPSTLKVEDLVGVEMEFQRVGDEIRMKPKPKTGS